MSGPFSSRDSVQSKSRVKAPSSVNPVIDPPWVFAAKRRVLQSDNRMRWRCLWSLIPCEWNKICKKSECAERDCFSARRLGQDGARRGHAAVQKPLWQGRSLRQVWCPVPSEQLDQPRETRGMTCYSPCGSSSLCIVNNRLQLELLCGIVKSGSPSM